MIKHPAIELVAERIVKDVIGGAVDTAKEVMDAMAKVGEDTKAQNVMDLYNEIEQAAYSILKVCPSFAPPINVLHMMVGSVERDLESNTTLNEAKKNLRKTRDNFHDFITTALDKISNIGAELIKDGDKVFMFSMSSSVWKVLRKAKENGKNFSVFVTEARPGNEGLWTVDEMEKSGIPVFVSIDACIAELVSQCDIAFAGVDAVGADGSVFNKCGTYLVALAAKNKGVPFYFVTDTLKFDSATLLGLPYRSDSVKFDEVLANRPKSEFVDVVGTLFDSTPPELITAIVTELGPIHPASCVNVIWNMKLSKRISELLPDWAYGKL